MMLLTVLMAFVGAQTAWADAVNLSVDNDFAEGTAGHYYVNMPTGDGNVLTISDSDIAGGKGTFKFYDNGGKGGNYSDGFNGYLVITAPEGYKINLTGSIAISGNDEFGVWEGYDTDHFGTQLISFSPYYTPFAPEYSPINITSGGNSVIVWFASNNSLAGWDLTVTLVSTDYDITVATATNGSVAASVGGTDATTAKESQTVTLTATPAEGYLLADLSVTCGGEAVELAWDVWTNSATFTMPGGDVTVTPTFTTKSDLFAIIPKTGTRTVTIPEGVTSFKVYDDGGPDGDYSPNCDGWLEINLPDGYRFHLSGSVTTDAPSSDRLSIYKGDRDHERQRVRSDNAGVAKSFTYDSDAAILLRFLSNYANQYAGVDLTVTLVGASYSVTVNNADTSKGTVTASVGGEPVTSATAGQTVTLTATPADGYVLGALSVRDADGKVVDLIDYMTESDMLWYTGNNTAVFTMPRSDVTVTPVFTNVMTADGGLTVNMGPMIRDQSSQAEIVYISNVKKVTIPSGVTSFKVYDYGGADCNYSDNYGGKLLLTAPEGCVLQLSGSITTQSGDTDVLTAYDGTDALVSDYLLNHVSSTSDGVATAIPTVVSTVQTIEIRFSTDDSENYAGLDLTVTVISPGTDYSVSVATAEGGTMEASTTTAQLGDVVTLTATPASGCVLSGLSVTCGGQAVKTNWNVWTNSATFKMPNGDVSVTPTFTSDLANFSVNLPVKGHKDATIPEGVASFKIYDDGGANGNYTPYCRGVLGLTAPEGSLLWFTGSVAGPDDKFYLKVVDYETNFSRNDIDVTSTNNKPGISFGYTVDSATGAGLDLTATVLYAVNVATGIAGGTVTPDKAHAAAGETVTLTVTPNADYTIGTVSINGQPLEADAGVYSFTMPAANVTVDNLFRKLLTNADIAVADIPSQTYDGTVLTPVVTITDANGGSAKTLTQNEDYSLSHESCQDAGDYTVTITGIGAYDGSTTKTFTIARRSVTLTSGSETRPYDGTALTNNGVSVDGNGFAEGEGAIYDVTGSQTDAGSSANTFTYTLNTGTKAANYDIQKTEGTLTVEPLTGVTVTITGHTTTVTFDGEEHSVSGYEYASSSELYAEGYFSFSGDASASRSDAGTVYMGLTSADFANINPNFDVTFDVTDGFVTIAYYAAELADNADNTAAISEILSTYGGKADVKLTGRKLWKDGDWNTLTLPFDVVLEGSPLENAVARPLSAASIEGTTLNLTFGDAVTTLAAGVPYIIKWTKDEVNPTIDDPVFSGVTINATDNSFDTERLTNQSSADYDEDFATDERVRFIGTYSPKTFNDVDKSILFLGTGNKLYYPQPVIDNDNPANSKYPTIGAQRAYFKIGEDSSSARQLTAFNLSFDGDGTQNGIGHTEITEITEKAGAWYTLDGVRLDGKPTKKGLYIHGGRKVVIK